MTTKKAATKVARILRSFGLSWGDSHKWGRKLAQTYDFWWNDLESVREGILEALEDSCFPQWDEFFEIRWGEMDYSEWYEESYVIYEIVVKKTNETISVFRYI